MDQQINKPISEFGPWPWQVEPWRNVNEVMLLTGSAGGGKSRLAGEKVHGFLLHYGGATGVISRKAEDDMKQSTIPLMLETVIDIQREPRCTYSARQNRVRYENGSELIFTGIWDERAREGLRSIGKQGAVDIWWLEEGIEFEEDDYNAINARMRGVAAPWTQIIVSTNPGPKLHWINRILRLGNDPRVSVFYSSAKDNPLNPKSYFSALDRLTGIEGSRLRDGKWIDGVGMVIDTWIDDPNSVSTSVSPLAEYRKDDGDLFWYMDDGYSGEQDEKTGWFTAKSNPRVFLVGQRGRNDIIKIISEDFRVQELASKHITDMLEFHASQGWPKPKYAVYDGAAPSLGGELDRLGVYSIPIRVKIDEGIKELRSWVGEDQNAIRRLIANPRCSMLRFEMGSYAYDKYGNPIDAYNHGIDALRYGVWHEAYGRKGDVSVMAPGIDGVAIDKKIAKVMARLEEKFRNAYS
jgi:phage terminase large subunit